VEQQEGVVVVGGHAQPIPPTCSPVGAWKPTRKAIKIIWAQQQAAMHCKAAHTMSNTARTMQLPYL
jgi:hypothetical protein